jgi:hypothetical protein
MRLAIAASLTVLLLAGAFPAAQPPSDLDQLMERVLARRDENWKKLQQYLLDEKETFDLTGPGGARLFGFRRDYSWYMRDGLFVRSPVRADGVTLSESARREAEADWIRRERRREQRRAARAREAAARAESAGSAEATPTSSAPAPSAPAAADPSAPSAADPSASSAADPSASSAAALVSVEPAFVSHAYFLRFRFEPNHYALAGREMFEGRSVLRIEYYPTELFREGRTRPNRRIRDREEDIEDKMNKVSLITLWVDPEAHQVLQYTFDDIDMDFLPGRSLARVDDVKATMRMGQPFPDVWLPRDIEMRFRMTIATGAFDARYLVQYHDYRQADVTYKVR